MDKKLVRIFSLSFFITSKLIYAQFAPAAGQIGSDAIHKDSSVFTAWANQCYLSRSYQTLLDSNLGLTQVGDEFSALDMPLQNGVVSLGDNGYIICQFQNPIKNGPGPDFAVFENSFSDHFLELAFVEVSSDGILYERFPAQSLTQTHIQVGPFDTLETTKIHHLAGKYRAGYGTPFDLDSLTNHSWLDKENIRYIKIIDVIGSIDSTLGSKDAFGRLINDPFPTPFSSGGFDLDAIGVMHLQLMLESIVQPEIRLFPNPCTRGAALHSNETLDQTLQWKNMLGQVFYSEKAPQTPGLYYIEGISNKIKFHQKILVL